MANGAIKTEVAVIGAGPGGYVAAIRLAQLGKKVALIDRNELGGICLQCGCIPSKALIAAAELFGKIKEASIMGINVGSVSIDFSKLIEWKSSIILKLTRGIEFLCKQNNVEIVKGAASFESSNKLKIEGNDNVSSVEFDKAVIAVGSKPIELPNFKFGGKIISSTEALSLEKIPGKLVVIGGGYIGLELGIVYAKLGSKVSVVETTGQLLPGFDASIVAVLERNIRKIGIDVYLNSKANGFDGGKVSVDSKEKGAVSLEADNVLVAVGRVPIAKELGIENTKVKLDEKGFIKVDKKLMSSDKNIYAIGDVSEGPMLAHKASAQGKFVAEVVAGKKIKYEQLLVPFVIFTDPEIATVGISESEAASKGIKVKSGRFPFSALGRAMTKNETGGFVKIIANEEDEKVIGVEIIGSDASDLISEAALAIKLGATLEDVASTIHPHPTLSESLMEAAEATMGKAVHIFNAKKE